jgi:recombination protein RecT
MNESLTVSTPKELLAYLEKSKSAIAMALPQHLNPDRMMRLALTCFSTQPAIRLCTPQSILSSIVIASQLGLEPGVAGQGYLIPYKTTCTFVPGWQGLVGLLNNTGRATAWSGAVFDGDEWDFQLGSKPSCYHKPGSNYGDPDAITWSYACGKVNGSEQPVVEAWPMGRVWKHRDKFNKVGAMHYSFKNEEMYARKVVLLQVLKYMPRSIELNQAIQIADASVVGKPVTIQDGVVVDVDPEEGNRVENATPTAGTSQPARANGETPQDQLARTAKYSVDDLIVWGRKTGFFSESEVDNILDFKSLTKDQASRLLRAKDKVDQGIAAMKGAA